mgnify:CR=1 FL=1
MNEMFGKMMHQSLLISNLIEHAAKYHADTSIFSREVNGQITTTNWLQVQQNSKRLANAFTSFNLNLILTKVIVLQRSRGTTTVI